MEYRIWGSTDDFAEYIVNNTNLKNKNVIYKKIYESDANNPKNFHSMPDHIKKILYLDAPDLIIEQNNEPILSIEISSEAGTGHNVFQRFARLAAAVENKVPAFYIYPEAVVIKRKKSLPKWDKINPLIFRALEEVMSIYDIPAFFYYFPSDFNQLKNTPDKSLNPKGLKYDDEYISCPSSHDAEMKELFNGINEVLTIMDKHGVADGQKKLLRSLPMRARRAFMGKEFQRKGGSLDWSPVTATRIVKTEEVIKLLSVYENKDYSIGELLKSRAESVLYQVDAKFRGDPYPGALAALDYLLCREGPTFEDRKKNLILVFGKIIEETDGRISIEKNPTRTINDFLSAVKKSESKNNILQNDFAEVVSKNQIPRYYMQVRYGSSFSKVKHIRVYSYFADAIIFPDGSLWRDA